MKSILRIVALFSALAIPAASAQVLQQFDQWSVIRSADGKDFIAYTANSQGSTLGFRCFTADQTCLHVVLLGEMCTNGDEYPMLINTSGGAIAINGTCSVNGSSYEILLKPYDEIHNLIGKADQIGIVVPLESGMFKVARFSGRGSLDAMKNVQDRARRLDSDESYL